jgi:hypothetical protein
MRRLNFLQDDPWDEVNDEISRVRWFGHPGVPEGGDQGVIARFELEPDE